MQSEIYVEAENDFEFSNERAKAESALNVSNQNLSDQREQGGALVRRRRGFLGTSFLSAMFPAMVLFSILFFGFFFSTREVVAEGRKRSGARTGEGGISPAGTLSENGVDEEDEKNRVSAGKRRKKRKRKQLSGGGASGSDAGGITKRAPSLEQRTYAVQTDGKRAYLATTSGLIVLDVSKIQEPERVGGLLLPDSGNGLSLSRGRVYLAQGNYGLVVVDVKRHKWPREIGRIKTKGAAQGVAVVRNYAFVADGSSGLVVVDIRKPSNMKTVARLSTEGYAWDVVAKRNRAYVAAGTSGVAVFDVSRPKKPRLLSVVKLDGGEDNGEKKGRIRERGIGLQARGLVLGSGGLLYVAAGSGGLVIVDISSAKPKVVGGLRLADFARGVTVLNRRGKKDNVLVADGQAGVFSVSVEKKGRRGKVEIISRLQGKLKTKMAVNNVFALRKGGKGLVFVAHDADGMLVIDTEGRGKEPLKILGRWPQAK